MQTLTIFYLDGCPYCRDAMRAAEELRAELSCSPDRIEWIEERRCADVADRYDYYRVPSVFCGDRKLYECSPGDDFAAIKRQLRRAIESTICD